MVATTNWIQRLSSEGSIRDEAISQLREILVRGLRKSLRNRGIDDAFVEDIVQDALLRILASLDTFEGRSQFTTWAMAIAVRTAIGEMRRRHFKDVSLEQIVGESGATLEIEDEDRTTTAEQMDKQALYDELRRRIETELTQRQQTVILALLGGMPVETIADRMGTNRNAVYKMMHDARMKLKKAFESSGVTGEEIQGILAGGA